ncbi:L10-interacting MYB domain-containing protein [Arachis hypogaea]|nr:L10-interacting MYB domain-containing protein [Arachis hypogaea]
MAKRALCQGETTSRDTLRWTDEMDTTFIDALIEESRKGNRVDGTFTTMAYDNILSLLRSIYGNHIRKENLKNRLKTLKDHFGVCYDNFHGLSGFSWNPITKMFEAEAEVWEELIKAKPEVKKWMRTPIKHYDKLFEIYGTDKATEKHAESAKEKVKRWEKSKEKINLNDDESFLNMEEEWNEDPITPHATSFTMGHSPEIGLSNQSAGSQGTSSRGTKRKTTMSDKLESEMETMSKGIQALTDMMKDGNHFYERSINIAEKQVLTAEEQVQVAKEQVQIAKQQVRIAERGLVILEQSRPRIYSENDVWNELENLGVMPELRMRCYRFLCREDRAKREFFGVPADVRLATLYELMKEAGAL